MAQREKTLQERIGAEANEIRREIAHWCYMREYGCSDPSWPAEYYLPTPPEVPKWYMADITSDRAKKLMRLHPLLTRKKPESYPEQGAMF